MEVLADERLRLIPTVSAHVQVVVRFLSGSDTYHDDAAVAQKLKAWRHALVTEDIRGVKVIVKTVELNRCLETTNYYAPLPLGVAEREPETSAACCFVGART